MKRKRHTRAEILLKVGQAKADLEAGVPFDRVCIEQKVTAQTLERWLRKHGSPRSQQDQTISLKQAELENRRLRKQIATLEYDKQILSEAVQGNF